MKAGVLCTLFFVSLMPVSWSQESPKPTKDAGAIQRSPVTTEAYHFKIEPEPAGDQQLFCAYMRTYRVKREYQDSDFVRPTGYAECIPTQRFEVKRAFEIQKDPDRRER